MIFCFLDQCTQACVHPVEEDLASVVEVPSIAAGTLDMDSANVLLVTLTQSPDAILARVWKPSSVLREVV
jgi:hypothetical protein